MCSLIKNGLFKFGTKSNLLYVCISNAVRLNRVQFYTCLCNSANIKVLHRSDGMGKHPMYTEAFLSSVSETTDKIKGFVKGIVNKVFVPYYARKILIGFKWYQTLDRVDYREFFTLLNMPDTFYSWFKVTELHVWMLLFKLMQDGDDNRIIRNGVIEALWMDVEKRAKLVDQLNRNYKSNVSTLNNKFKTTLFIYDEGYLSNDMVLTSALWDKFFDQQCDDPRLLETLISYIRYQINQLQMVNTKIDIKAKNLDELILSKKLWTSLEPHFKQILS